MEKSENPEATVPPAPWTPTRFARNGEVNIAHDRLVVPASDEPDAGEPLLLIMGLAVSRRWWPLGLCEAFAAAGFAVVRYDQRDAGESTHLPPTKTSNPFSALFGKRGDAYTAEDMADDAIAVMDDLGWESAHLFGHSLGGAIAQRIALRHPTRVRTLTSSAALPSDVGGLSVVRYLRFGTLAKLARQKHPDTREGRIAAGVAVARAVASPGYPFDEEAARAWVELDLDTGIADNGAQSRQIGAQWHGPKLTTLDKPTLVLHGEEDQILRLKAGRATAAAIRGSRLVTYPGVGHDLPAPLWKTVAEEVRVLATT
ncbi:alpha/beta fold hydrolase [Streptomyces sp. SID3343]|nr:alpha/beta fold hydrolase [Streptomyces sp. SID3343]